MRDFVNNCILGEKYCPSESAIKGSLFSLFLYVKFLRAGLPVKKFNLSFGFNVLEYITKALFGGLISHSV